MTTLVGLRRRAMTTGNPTMLRPLLAGFALVLATVVARSADDTDPIKAKLDRAKARYEQDIEKHRAAVGKWFDEQIEKARGLKDNKKAVDRLSAERAAFDATGLLPDIKATKPLRDKGDAARTELDRAYQKAVKDYTSAGDDKSAAGVEKDFVKYIVTTSGPRLVGRWKYDNNYIDVYYSDLTMVQYNPSGQVHVKGDWQVEKNGTVRLALRNGWNAEGRLKELDRYSWVYRGPRGEVNAHEFKRLPK